MPTSRPAIAGQPDELLDADSARVGASTPSCAAPVERAGLPATVHLHRLRHGYAARLDGASVPFTTVLEPLGDATQGVTWST